MHPIFDLNVNPLRHTLQSKMFLDPMSLVVLPRGQFLQIPLLACEEYFPISHGIQAGLVASR